jgi:hypothetical protein
MFGPSLLALALVSLVGGAEVPPSDVSEVVVIEVTFPSTPERGDLQDVVVQPRANQPAEVNAKKPRAIKPRARSSHTDRDGWVPWSVRNPGPPRVATGPAAENTPSDRADPGVGRNSRQATASPPTTVAREEVGVGDSAMLGLSLLALAFVSLVAGGEVPPSDVSEVVVIEVTIPSTPEHGDLQDVVVQPRENQPAEVNPAKKKRPKR